MATGHNGGINPASPPPLIQLSLCLSQSFPLHSWPPVSPLSDFHPPSWENRREISWQRWGEGERVERGFSDEEKKGLLRWKGALFCSSTLQQLHLCDLVEPAHYCVSLNQGTVSLSNVQAPLLQCSCSKTSPLLSAKDHWTPCSVCLMGTFLSAVIVNENRPGNYVKYVKDLKKDNECECVYF